MNRETEPEEGRRCVPNLGPRQRRLRVVFGCVGLAVAIGLGAALFALEAPRWTRAALLLPSWGAALGFLQAREKT
jgi:hypothetical protein